MTTFLPPPDGVPIEPIKHPYAIENRIVADKPFICDSSEDVKLINDIPIGNIIAATVCSPIKEDNNADIDKNPKAMLYVLLPVIFKIPNAILESQPCLMITTASMSEPIIKKTASLIKDFAMPSTESTFAYIWDIMIKIATAGKGIGSLIINTKATTKIITAVLPSLGKPSGEGTFNKQTPKNIENRNHFFCVAQKRKLLNEILEKPNKKFSKWT